MPTPSDTSPQSVECNLIDSDNDDLQCLDWLQNFSLLQSTELLPQLNQKIVKDSDKCSLVSNTEVENSIKTIQAAATLPENDAVSPIFASDLLQQSSALIQASHSSPNNARKFQKFRRKPFQCTFNCMVFRAIETSPYKALQLRSIYDWISERHNYFKTAGSQWHNSVRHSLSLNKCFYRLNIDLPDESGTKCNRSSWWTIHPDYRKVFSDSVLDNGPNHRCLPRGIMVAHELDAITTLSPSSENELATLANDIKAAAAILTLSAQRKNSKTNDQHVKDVVDCVASAAKFIAKPNSFVEIPQTRVLVKNYQSALPIVRPNVPKKNVLRSPAKPEFLEFPTSRNRKKRRVSASPEKCTVETQTEECRIAQNSCVVEQLDYDDDDMKIALNLDVYNNSIHSAPALPTCHNSIEDSIQETVRCLMSSDSTESTDSPQNSYNIRRNPRKALMVKKKIKKENAKDVASSWNLLRFIDQKCPMDQELL